MKKYIKSSEDFSDAIEFNIDIIYFLANDIDDVSVVATNYMGFDIPDGSLISGDKDAVISAQEQADYDSFIETIEDFIMDNLGLELAYYDDHENSRYYSFFAKDNNGKVLFKFRLRLRLSTHNPHRTEEQKKHKAEEDAEVNKWVHSHQDYNGRTKPAKLPKLILINRENFNDYLDAFIYIKGEMEHAIYVMKNR